MAGPRSRSGRSSVRVVRPGPRMTSLKTPMPVVRPMPTPDERHEFATGVVRQLREAGFQALWAGGCVRDLTLGLMPSDYDVATDARPEQVMDLFRRRTVPVGESFGVVRVLGTHGSGLEVEVAT